MKFSHCFEFYHGIKQISFLIFEIICQKYYDTENVFFYRNDLLLIL